MTTDDRLTAAAPAAAGDDGARERLWEIVRATRFAMATTIGSGGALRSRPLTTQNDRGDIGDKLYFFVAADSEVAHDLAAEPRIGIAYADTDKDRYVSISGLARVVHDRQRQHALWTPLARSWFPGGADDASLRVLEVQMASAEFWDARSSRLTQLLKMARSAIGGQPPTDIGGHTEVAIR